MYLFRRFNCFLLTILMLRFSKSRESKMRKRKLKERFRVKMMKKKITLSMLIMAMIVLEHCYVVSFFLLSSIPWRLVAFCSSKSEEVTAVTKTGWALFNWKSLFLFQCFLSFWVDLFLLTSDKLSMENQSGKRKRWCKVCIADSRVVAQHAIQVVQHFFYLNLGSGNKTQTNR